MRIIGEVWVAAGYPWSVRLKALLPVWMPWVRKRFGLDAVSERKPRAISAATIDRRLKTKKVALRRRLYGRTMPDSLLKHQIPIKTDSWDITVARFMEVDLVSNSGSCGDGEFMHSLNMTDIDTSLTCAVF